MKIVLMGNPNVGKSVIFSRLTGAGVIAANYPGTTVDFTKGKMKLGEKTFEIIDAPGTYSLMPSNKAEEVAKKLFDEADLVINVVDATNLERNLFLTLELLEGNKPVVIALNLWDEARHEGIEIDLKKLEKILDTPIVATVALTGEGIKELTERIKDAKAKERKKTSDDEKWMEIGRIVKIVQKVRHRHHTLKDRLSEASIKPFTGLPIAIFVLLISFLSVRFIAEEIIKYISDPLFEIYKIFIMKIGDFLGEGFIHDVIIGKLIDGEIDFMQSLGLLTTGLYVPFGVVLPYIFSFYLILAILEDTGYLPRLSTLVDNIFHRLGMHGSGIISVFLGLGCNVPGVLSSRILDTKRQRFITATLIGIAIPCMAQTAMIFAILGKYGIKYILIVYSTLAIIFISGGLLLNKFLKGESSEIFLEIPPYRLPSISSIFKKTYMRIKWFLADALPWLFAGVFITGILYSSDIISKIANIFSPLMQPIFGLPGEAAVPLLMGFVRKDLAAGLLLPLGLSAPQLVVAVTVLAIYFPCVATFAVLLKELGWKDMIKSTTIMLFTALFVGFIMKTILI
ncbi:MAG: ferrous iron transporter B [Thermoplasmatales archaeon]|nr:ferrous iron transporter B [Thermoplasmatales archaeon]